MPLTTGAVLAWLAHGLVSALVVLLVMRLSGRLFAGLAAGLIFAAHPVNVEALAWSEARSVPVAVLIALAASALWFEVPGITKSLAKGIPLRLLVLGLVVFAGRLHPAAAAAPLCAWAAMEIRGRGERNSYRSFAKHWPLVPAAVLAAIIGSGAGAPASGGGLWAGLADAMGSSLVPWRLMPDYGLLYAGWSSDAGVLYSGVVVVALAAAAWVLNKRFPAARAGLSWLLTPLVFAAFLGEALVLLPRKIAVALLVVVVGLFGTKTLYQGAAWQSEEGVLRLFLDQVPAAGQLEVARRYSRLGEEKERAARELERKAKALSKEKRTELAEDARGRALRLRDEATGLFRSARSALFKAETARSPTDPELLATTGTVALHLGNHLRARELLEKAVEKMEPGPERARLLVLLGAISARIGYRDRAIKLYKQATEEDPESASAFKGLGIACFTSGRATDALRALRRAGELRPDDADFLNRLGHVFMDLLLYKEAEKHFMKALEADPENRKYRDDLDRARLVMRSRRRDPEKAREALRKAKEAFARGERLEARAVNAGTPGELLGAAEAYKRAIANAPNNHAAHFRRGVCLALYGARLAEFEKRREHLTEAADHFRAAHTFAPENEDYLFALAQAYRDLGRTKDAEEHLAKILKLNPRSGRAHYRLAELYAVQLGDAARARAKVGEARKLGFAAEPAFLDLLVDLEFGPVSQEERDAERAWRAASSEAEILLQQKDLASAVGAYARAYDALEGFDRPRLVRIRQRVAFKAGLSCEGAKAYQKALEWIMKARDLTPRGRKDGYDADIERIEGLIAGPKGKASD
ncbi:MAG: tetratricopeptide repeat protein [Planctomycetota bacterium]